MGVADAPSPAVGDVQLKTNGEAKKAVLALRALTLVLLIIAIVLMVTDKQTQSISVSLPGIGSSISLKKTATYTQITGVKYYVGALSVAAAYMFFQTLAGLFTLVKTGSIVGTKSRAWVTFILDQLIAYLMVSAATAVSEVGYIARRGETKVGWNQVCSDFERYCLIYGISLVNAFLATVAFIPLVAVSAFHLFRMYGTQSAPSK